MYIHVDYYSYICTYRQPTHQWQIDRVSVADKPIDDALWKPRRVGDKLSDHKLHHLEHNIICILYIHIYVCIYIYTFIHYNYN